MADEASQDFVLMTLGGRAFAFPIEVVREVIDLVEPTPMPSWPAWALGMVELRGSFLPLLDAAEALGLAPSPLRLQSKIAIVDARGKTVGLLVDGVEGVQSAPMQPIGALGPAANERRAVGLGVVRSGGAAVVVLDAAALVQGLTEGTALAALPGGAP